MLTFDLMITLVLDIPSPLAGEGIKRSAISLMFIERKNIEK
jgi:hypothetical protein